MALDSKLLSQHKLLAMGRGTKSASDAGASDKGGKREFARGGMVAANNRLLKTGIPDSPLENAKRNNGIPGFAKGGAAKKKK